MQAGTLLTVRVAAGAAEREATIARWLRTLGPAATAARLVLAEGMLFDRAGPQDVPMIALTACPCCVGAVALRVNLTRALREFRPARVLIVLAGEAHLPRLRRMLAESDFGVRVQIEGEEGSQHP